MRTRGKKPGGVFNAARRISGEQELSARMPLEAHAVLDADACSLILGRNVGNELNGSGPPAVNICVRCRSI